MTWSVKRLVSSYPKLYHMATLGSWPSIEQHGLLSTSALLDLFDIGEPQRSQIESERRPSGVPINHVVHGRAVVRDQIPLREAALRACLVDMEPTEWYRLLNAMTFFWPTEDRLRSMLSARAYKNSQHTVLEIDSASLMEDHAERTRLSSINSGATLYTPPKRGRETFRAIADYEGTQVAEVAIYHSVPNIRDYVVRVVERDAVSISQILWTAEKADS